MAKQIHRILEHDDENKTVTCQNCGVVTLTYRNGRPACSVARRQQRGERGTNSTKKANGYRLRWRDGQWVREHRLVMEEMIGRPLLPHENVHHINGNRTDNRPENLELWSTSQPSGQRVADKVAWAREIIALYADDFTLAA